MARVKRGVTTHARHKKVLDSAKGYRGRGKNNYRIAIEQVEKGLQYAYRDRRDKQAQFPRAVDPAHQRRRARARPDLFQLMNGIKQGRHRARPQGAGRSRGARAGGVPALVEQARAALQSRVTGLRARRLRPRTGATAAALRRPLFV